MTASIAGLRARSCMVKLHAGQALTSARHRAGIWGLDDARARGRAPLGGRRGVDHVEFGAVSTPELSNERIEELAALRALDRSELASRALPRAHIALIERLQTINGAGGRGCRAP